MVALEIRLSPMEMVQVACRDTHALTFSAEGYAVYRRRDGRRNCPISSNHSGEGASMSIGARDFSRMLRAIRRDQL